MHVNVFDFSELLARSPRRYSEFLRVSSLSVGIYALEQGERDPQKPHTLVGRVVPILVGLVAMSADGSARHSPPMAPQSFRLALDQEIAPPSRKTGGCGEHS
jgi:hypothetical protein